MPRFITLSVLVLVTILNARAASAESADAAREEARAAFEEGLELVQQERWEDALEAFDASLQRYPTQTALFNRALCYGLAGRPVDALRDLEQHIAEYGESVDSERRQAVEEEIERQRRRIGQLSVEADSDVIAQVLVDGIEIGETPLAEPIAVNPGRHQVTLRAEGYESLSQWVEVGSGDETSLLFELAELPEEPATTQPIEPVDEPPLRPDTGRGLRIGGWISAGLAVAALGAALGLFLFNNGEYDEWLTDDAAYRATLTGDSPQGSGGEAAARLDADIAEHNETAGRIETTDSVTWVMLGLGSAATIAAALLITLGVQRRGGEEPPLALIPTTNGLLLSGGF